MAVAIALLTLMDTKVPATQTKPPAMIVETARHEPTQFFRNASLPPPK